MDSHQTHQGQQKALHAGSAAGGGRCCHIVCQRHLFRSQSAVPDRISRIFAGAGKAGHPVRERAGTPGVQAGGAGGTLRQPADTGHPHQPHPPLSLRYRRIPSGAGTEFYTSALQPAGPTTPAELSSPPKLPQHCGRSTVSFGKTASARPTSV